MKLASDIITPARAGKRIGRNRRRFRLANYPCLWAWAMALTVSLLAWAGIIAGLCWLSPL